MGKIAKIYLYLYWENSYSHPLVKILQTFLLKFNLPKLENVLNFLAREGQSLSHFYLGDTKNIYAFFIRSVWHVGEKECILKWPGGVKMAKWLGHHASVPGSHPASATLYNKWTLFSFCLHMYEYCTYSVHCAVHHFLNPVGCNYIQELQLYGRVFIRMSQIYYFSIFS